MKKTLLMTALILGVSAAAISAQAADNAGEFAQKAAYAGNFEIESSKLALERSSNAEVKAFAKKMIDDHTAAGAQLKAVAKEAGITLSDAATLDEKQQKELDKLKETKASDFDDEYLDAQEDAHEDAVKLFKDYSKDGDNEKLREFATKTLPTLESHHTAVEKLDDKDNAKERANMKSEIKEDYTKMKEKTSAEYNEMKTDAKQKIEEMKK